MSVLITGSSKGLGREIARVFANNKYDVIINYNNSYEEASLLYDELKNITNVKLIKADISKEEEVKKIFEENDIDILINNAAIAFDKSPLEKESDEFRKVIDVNLIGTFLTCKYMGIYSKKGKILNISSTNAIDTYYPESIDYDASKAGVISLTHNFAKFYNGDILVNVLCPDWINTSMNDDMDEFYKSKIKFLDAKDVAKKVFEIATSDKNDEVIRLEAK